MITDVEGPYEGALSGGSVSGSSTAARQGPDIEHLGTEPSAHGDPARSRQPDGVQVGAAQPQGGHIALDGPSGSGKSTVARAVALRFGWRYVDTGATYRAATAAVLEAGLDPSDEAAVTQLITALVARDGLTLVTDPAEPTVRLDGRDVSSDIRGASVTAAVSAVSAHPGVRSLLVALQRDCAGPAAVVEGRDIASVVLPDAAVKVYLDADPAVRAARRAADTDAGVTGPPDVHAVAADLARRDRLDSSRAASPLVAADGAVHLDATALSAAEVADAVVRLAEEAGLVV